MDDKLLNPHEASWLSRSPELLRVADEGSPTPPQPPFFSEHCCAWNFQGYWMLT